MSFKNSMLSIRFACGDRLLCAIESRSARRNSASPLLIQPTAHRFPGSSHRSSAQVPHAQQIEHRGRKGHRRTHALEATDHRSSHSAVLLRPAKSRLDQLALALADRVAGVARRPLVQGRSTAAPFVPHFNPFTQGFRHLPMTRAEQRDIARVARAWPAHAGTGILGLCAGPAEEPGHERAGGLPALATAFPDQHEQGPAS